MGRSIDVTIGERIPYENLDNLRDRGELALHLRKRTYALGQAAI